MPTSESKLDDDSSTESAGGEVYRCSRHSDDFGTDGEVCNLRFAHDHTPCGFRRQQVNISTTAAFGQRSERTGRRGDHTSVTHMLLVSHIPGLGEEQEVKGGVQSFVMHSHFGVHQPVNVDVSDSQGKRDLVRSWFASGFVFFKGRPSSIITDEH